MRKNFVRVMLFGALALATSTAVTSCTDYDDDVKNLQEQIDKITAKNPVSTEDMKTAIASAITTLQTQLQKAIDGKANNADVVALQTAVRDLQTALAEKADQSKITELTEKIAELSTKVNGIEGSLDETKAALEAKIAELEAKLSNTVDQEELAAIVADLTTTKNELAAVKEMAENNTSAIVQLTADIAKLQALETRIAALEEANKSFAAKSDLDVYTKTSEMADLISGEVAKHLADDGQIAQYVNDAITTKVLAETSAINVAINGIDTKLNNLDAAFNTYKGQQSTNYNKVIERLDDLERYDAAIMKALADGEYKDFAAVLTQITDLKEGFGECVKTDNLGNEVNAYLKSALDDKNSEFSILTEKVKQLGIDVEALKAMIQSVVFIPTNVAGTVNFTSLYAKKTIDAEYSIISKTSNIVVKFRVSPASAAANFKEKYNVMFDGQVITRSTSAFTIVDVANDANDAGIINVTMKPGDAAKDHALCLMIQSKAPAADATDKTTVATNVSSNYFPVLMTSKYMQDAKVAVNTQMHATIFYDTDGSKADFSTVGRIQIMASNASNEQGYSYEDLASPTYAGVDQSLFSVKYSVTNEDYFQVGDAGSVALKAYNLADYVGKTSNVVAKVAIANVYLKQNTPATLGDVVVKKTVNTNEYTYITPIEVEWSNSVQNVAATNFPLADLYNKFNITDTEFKTLRSEVESSDVMFEVGVNNALSASVSAGKKAGNYPIKVVFTSADGSKVYTVSATIKVAYPQVALLEVDPMFWKDNAVLFTPTLTPDLTAPSAITTTQTLSQIFKNYAAASQSIAGIPGASMTLQVICGTGTTAYDVTTTPRDGLTYNAATTVLTIDKDVYAGKAISVKSIVKFGTEAVQTLAASISITNISGTWVAGSKAVTLVNKANTVDLATGFSWTDSRSKAMWNKDGEVTGNASATNGFATGTKALALYGLKAPKFYFVDEAGQKINSDKYLALDGNKIEFTPAGKNYYFQEAYTVRVKVDAASQWGTIANYAGNEIITVTIQKGL